MTFGLQLSYLTEPPIPLVREVMQFGQEVPSRYGMTREMIGGRFECQNGILVDRPGINYSLGWMELLQLVAGVYDLKAIQRVAPQADHSLFTPKMAYGPRVSTQIIDAIAALKKTPLTRQAVLFVGKDHDGMTADLPCTLTIQFLMRKDKLNCFVAMRSWDLCLGLPYDIMMFQGLQAIIARCVGVFAGQLVVTAGSTHIYHEQKAKVPYWSKTRWGIDLDLHTWQEFVEWAHLWVSLLEKGETPEGIATYQMK